MRTSIDTDSAGARSLLEAIADRTEHAEPGLSLVLDEFMSRERALFASQPWASLDPDTVERKQRDPQTAGNARTEMVGTGRLRRFLTSRGPGGQPLALNDRELRVGIPAGRSSVFYARHLAKAGRNPVIPVGEVRKFAPPRLARWLVRG